MPTQLVDASTNLGTVAQCLSREGVKAVGRYYNYGAGGKVLTRQEAQALIANDISIWVVFQYYGNHPTWFTAECGKSDALRALQCAHEIVGQPEGTAIYFGADYDEDGTHYESNIVPYFQAVRDVFARPGGKPPYRVGVYSDGLVCRRLLDDGLVTETWLSCSRSFPEHAGFLASNRWSLSQTCGVPPVCNVDVDSDEANATRRDYGQFDRLVPLKASHTAVIATEMLDTFLAKANAADEPGDDPSNPLPGDESETADHATARWFVNVGLAFDGLGSARIRSDKVAVTDAIAAVAAAPTTIDLHITAAEQFLTACINARPRVTYGLGAKPPFPGAIPGVDFKKIDCSGFVREAIHRSETTQLGFPDGSVIQHEWVRGQGFASVPVSSGKALDGLVRIAFLRPQDTSSGIGHVVLIHNGKTLESHGGLGPDSLPWTGSGWQAKAHVYVLTAVAQ